MQPFPGLEKFGYTLNLPKSELKVFYFAAGEPENPALLLLHGLGDEADTWRHVIESLASSGYHVLAPDLPGFGRSQPLPGHYSFPRILEVLLEFMETLSLSQVTLVGHSLGAMLAHELALQHPDQVRRSILVSGSLVVRYQKFSLLSLLFLVPGVGELLYNSLRRNPKRAFESLRPYYRDLDALPEADRQFLFQRVNERVWSDTQRRAYLENLRSSVAWLSRQQKGLPDRLKHNIVPTILVWGEADGIYSLENDRLLASLQPETRLVELVGAGHNLQQEVPSKLVKIIQFG